MKFQDNISNMNTYIQYIHTYVRTYIRTSRNQYAPHFFKVGGIKMGGGGGVRLGGGGRVRGGRVGGGQGGCERRIKVFMKIQKKKKL